ncbi:MAG: hypothetical protein PF482_17355, partial [Desulfobacteraceae bacterium]|nr:hypothetical protein [Desulfobacteraceae bacterium]
NPVMCYSEHRFRLSLSSNVSIGEACRNDIVLAETMIKAQYNYIRILDPVLCDSCKNTQPAEKMLVFDKTAKFIYLPLLS